VAELEIKSTVFMRLRVIAIIWIALCVCVLLIYLLTGGRGEVFAATTNISTYLPDATGINPKTPVRLDGIQIGTVRHVQLSGRFDPQRAVFVGMTVKKRYLRNIPLDSTTAINADTLIGDKFIDINEGKSAAPLGDDGVLESEPVKQAADRADLIHALEDELRQIDLMLTIVSDPKSPLGQFIVGEAEYDEVLGRLKQFDSGLREFVSPGNPVGQMLFTRVLYDDLHKDVVRFDQQLAAIQNGEGTAGHLFASDQQYQDFVRETRGIRDSLAKLNSGQGPAGALLESDAGYNRIADALKRTDALLASLNAGEGQFGQLIRDPQVYESINGSLHSLEETLRDFRENPRKYLRYQVRKKKRKQAASK
jgi:phospholipid/cholesterol/gamma-HCH transport system substrate-binding protein